jgi:membrane protein implicated in regulation of membrane protease activity
MTALTIAGVAGLTEISPIGLLLLVANLLLGSVLGLVAWSLRRLVNQNDGVHRALSDRIDEQVANLTVAVEAEREARHQFHGQLGDRVWQVNSDLKENYQPRREGLRLFGSLAQTIEQQHREIMARLDGLPCRLPKCPGDAS